MGLSKRLSVFASLICSVLSAILCGCGKEDGGSRIGVSIPAADHGWSAGVVWNSEQAKAEIEKKYPGSEVLVVTAKNSADQVSGIENMLMRKVNALVVMSQDPVPLAGVCRKAKEKGTYLVIVSNPVEGVRPDVFVKGDNRSMGIEAAHAVGREIGGKGGIVLMKGQPCPIDNDRVGGFKETLAKEYPEIRILDEGDAFWKAEKGQQLMELFLQKHSVIDCVWAGDDDVLTGALLAYEKSGRKDVRGFVGGGGAKVIVKKIADKDPLVKATVTYSPAMIRTGIDAAVEKLFLNKEPAPEIVIRSEIVTPENARRYYFENSPY